MSNKAFEDIRLTSSKKSGDVRKNTPFFYSFQRPQFP